jgi:endonuclease YncB( thermonuclease family)
MTETAARAVDLIRQACAELSARDANTWQSDEQLLDALAKLGALTGHTGTRVGAIVQPTNAPIKGPAYEFLVDAQRVVDADTLALNIDLGFETWLHNTRVRLFGVDAPPVVGASKAAGIAAMKFVQNWFAANEYKALIRSYKAKQREKYGRWLVEVIDPDTGETLNAALLERGLATPMNERGGKA